ncbi:hypothetical protein LEP1GSC058_3405 [Leptospira fainei serovar Hurstbridge str. BUT 6]|uniref:Uncharacterized protein n=1 Tax=Leptospira fainei serovar Hurstbridge str. BUT 6 TaxID=1193011 RepID=S3UVW8_9LEPT|nr:hypothetical protein LEP1GSC058_3405 [Leptospira fainei serovar Hurstbridge str. BUT 6]
MYSRREIYTFSDFPRILFFSGVIPNLNGSKAAGGSGT